MTTLAKKYEPKFSSNMIDLDNVAVQKNQDYENETTAWIFEDGSALTLSSDEIVSVINNYGLSPDHEQLR